MRVLLVSDLHFDLRKFDAVLDHARDPSIDVVVVAGDILSVASALALDTQITVALDWLTRLAAVVPTVACSGNHDLDHRTEAGEKATAWITEARAGGVHVDGDSFDVDDWRFTAVAWWEGPVTLADLERRLGEAAADRPAHWAWVYHGPPEGPLSWTGSRHYGDPELPRLLETHRPDIVLCGHVHEAPFVEGGSWVEQVGGTVLFNAGFQPGDRPSFVELDLGDGQDRVVEASWWSATDAGRFDLATSGRV